MLSHCTTIFNHRAIKRKQNQTINVFSTVELHSAACNMTQAQARKQLQCAHDCPQTHLICRLLLTPAESHSSIFAIYRYTPCAFLSSHFLLYTCFTSVPLFTTPYRTHTRRAKSRLHWIRGGEGRLRERGGGLFKAQTALARFRFISLPFPRSQSKSLMFFIMKN